MADSALPIQPINPHFDFIQRTTEPQETPFRFTTAQRKGMDYSDESAVKPNGTVVVEYTGEDTASQEDVTLWTILKRLIGEVLYPDPPSPEYSLLHRLKSSVSANIPLLRPALRNSGRRVLEWTRQGSPLRALLVVSVGTISLIALTASVVFMLFFVTATINAVVISLLMSLAAAGGFLAIFFACVTAIYVGALSIAVFAISVTTVSAVIAVIIATGWIGFFYAIWVVARKGIDFAKHSLSMTGSAFAAYSNARRNHHSENAASKKSD